MKDLIHIPCRKYLKTKCNNLLKKSSDWLSNLITLRYVELNMIIK